MDKQDTIAFLKAWLTLPYTERMLVFVPFMSKKSLEMLAMQITWESKGKKRFIYPRHYEEFLNYNRYGNNHKTTV